jgi:hypothetical protein
MNDPFELRSLEEIEEMDRKRSQVTDSLESTRFARQPYQQETKLIFIFLHVMRVSFWLQKNAIRNHSFSFLHLHTILHLHQQDI